MRSAIPSGLVLLLLLANAGSAQMAPGARSVGMGGGGLVFASGVDAVEWNPANLAASDGWNVSVFEVGAAGLGQGATVNEMLAIFGADVGGAADVNVAQAVSNLPAEGIRLSFVTEGYTTALATERGEIPSPGSPLPSIGLAVGNVAVRLRSRVFSEINVSRELADLIGNGFLEENLQSYSVGNTGWQTTTVSEVTVSYGTTLGALMVGFGGRYMVGHGLVNGRFFEPLIDVNCVGGTPPPGCVPISIETVAIEAPSGSGFGFDFGLALDLTGGFRVSASGTNVIQKLNWSDELVAHTATFTDDDFDGVQDFVDLLDRFESETIDPNSVSLSVLAASDGLFEESFFPQTFRAGVGYQSGGTSVEASGVRVSPRGRFASPWDGRVSLGVEQELPLLTVRAGLARADQGINALTAGAGLGVGPIRVDVGAGRFSGGEDALSTWDGYFGTIALQLGGG